MDKQPPQLLRAVMPLIARLQRGLGELGYSRKEISEFMTRRIFEEEDNGSRKDIPQMLRRVLRGQEGGQGSDQLRVRLIHLLTRLQIEVGILDQYDRQTVSPPAQRASSSESRGRRVNARESLKLQAQASKQQEQYVTLAKLQEKISNNLEQVSQLRSMFLRNAQNTRNQLFDQVSSFSRPARSSVRQQIFEEISSSYSRPRGVEDRLGSIFSSRRQVQQGRDRRIELERERLRELQRLREVQRERMVAHEQELAEMERMWQLQRENKDMELMLSNVSSYENADELDEYAQF